MTRRPYRAGRWAALALMGVVGAWSTSSCDPCAQLSGCGSSRPTLSYTVEIIEHATGQPVAGASVTLFRTGGVALDHDTVSAVSGSDGFVTLRANAAQVGAVAGRIVVAPPPPRTPYSVDTLTFATSNVRGNGGVLGRWVVDPYIAYVGEVNNGFTGPHVAGARVTFVRRSGLAISPDTLTDVTDIGGRFFLQPKVLGATGVVVGDLYVQLANSSSQLRIANVPLNAAYLDAPPTVGGVFDVSALFGTATAPPSARAHGQPRPSAR